MKIVIIGGGTAGWIAAHMIWNSQGPQNTITVIENSKIGIIGTGEGTTGVFWDLINGRWGSPEIDEAEFMRETQATLKMGLKFVNWKGQGESWVAPIDGTPTMHRSWDWIMQQQIATEGQHSYGQITACGALANKNLSCYSRDLTHTYGYNAYHFDGHLVGQFFKKRLVAQGVEVLDRSIVTVDQAETGEITALIDDQGQRITGDYFIDASGFARVLHPYVKPGWISYSDSLTCDRAIPFQIKSDPLAGELEPVTVCRAMSAGWMWKIPTATRWGCGMVYDSRFQTEEGAVREAEQLLGQEIQPIKTIKFEPGRTERIFWKNTMLLGLNNLFLEPLQATSIHATIHSVGYLITHILRPHSLPSSELQLNWANENLGRVFDGYADLIQIHYRSGRSDTDFWRFQQEETQTRTAVAMLREIGQRRWYTLSDWHIAEGVAGYPVCVYPLLEYGWLRADPNSVQKTPPRFRAEYQRQQQLCRQLPGQCLGHSQAIRMIRDGQITTLRPKEFEPRQPSSQPMHPFLSPAAKPRQR